MVGVQVIIIKMMNGLQMKKKIIYGIVIIATIIIIIMVGKMITIIMVGEMIIIIMVGEMIIIIIQMIHGLNPKRRKIIIKII